jgi:hypothetical protein
MTKDKALQMAINALTNCSRFEEAIQACKEALEQPAQEPVAWYWDNNHRDKIPYVGVERGNPKMDDIFGTPIPLYTHPAPSWQGLSDDEIGVLFDSVMANDTESTEFFGIDFARAIEAKLKEKNS